MKWQWGFVLSILVGCNDDVAGAGLSTGTGSGAPTSGGSEMPGDTAETTSSGSTASTGSGGSEPPTGTTGPTSSGAGTESTSTSSTGDSSSGESSEGDDTSPEPLRCPVEVDEPPLLDCEFGPPLAEFAPVLQWSFTPDDGLVYSMTTPLVGNLTDDNGDGVIDLHDTPDVVLHAFGPPPLHRSALHVLDGATGALHFRISDTHWVSTPALGDIDGDGIMEIVVQDRSGRRVVAYEHDGVEKWRTEPIIKYSEHAGAALALADLDNDCDVEILFVDAILDHHGQLLHKFSPYPLYEREPSAADIDGDGDLEVLVSKGVFHHDGTVLFQPPAWDMHASVPEVADFDGDGLPEVLFSSEHGLTMMEHDGTVKFNDLLPLDQEQAAYLKPSAVYDLDGDGSLEFVKTSLFALAAYGGDAAVHWSTPLAPPAWPSAPTVFDLLGDGAPEVIHANEHLLWVSDHTGATLWSEPHSSNGDLNLPVVADIDNDQAAEFLVTSQGPGVDWYNGKPNPYPTLRAYRDENDRWAPARRIWNQQAYHVTNVREDGTIPQFEAPHWQALNTVHVQAHVGPAGVCKPPG